MKYTILLLMLATYAGAYSLDLLETNPSPVRSGEYADITVRLLTSDIDANNQDVVTFFVEENNDIRPIAGQASEYRSLERGRTVTKTFRVFFNEGLPAGNVPVTFVIQQGDGALKIVKDVFVSGSLRIPEFYIGSIDSIPDELLQDTRNNELTLKLQNLGEKKAELITVELIDVSDTLVESNTFSMRDTISSLEGGQEAEVEFSFDIEQTDTKLIDATLLLRFRIEDELTNSFETITENIDIQIPLAKAPKLSIVNVEPIEDILVKKQENQAIVTIINTGEEEAESVRLRLFPDPTQPFDFEKNNYFVTPKLEPGEDASVIVVFDVLDGAVIEEYNFDVQLESIVGSSRQIQKDTLKIPVTGEQIDGSSLVRTIIIAAAIIIALLLGIFAYKKRKK